MKGFIGEVKVFGENKWHHNALVFATYAEAEAYVFDLSCRWTMVRETRVSEVAQEPNYRWDAEAGKAVAL